MKKCPSCEEEKPRSEFGKHAKRYDGLQSICRVCFKSLRARWDLRNRESELAKSKEQWSNIRRANHLMHEYGIDEWDYAEMYVKQGAACAICKRFVDVAQVDHDHSTGKVRGLLCNSCNLALGMFKDSPEIILRAYSYLV